jgi:hypothetical protein
MPARTLTGHSDGWRVETATLTTSPHRYEMHTLREAWDDTFLRKGEAVASHLWSLFDYITDKTHEARLIRYKGEWIDVWDMEYLSPERLPQASVLAQLARDGWIGWASDSAWTGTIVKYLPDRDGFVRVARVVWS